jgi:hypothetical protein
VPVLLVERLAREEHLRRLGIGALSGHRYTVDRLRGVVAPNFAAANGKGR